MPVNLNDEVGVWHAKKLIRWCLEGSGDMGLSTLVRQTDMDQDLVHRAVTQLVQEGQAWPVQSRSASSTDSQSRASDPRCYRWNHDGEFHRIVISARRGP